jgi:23S rRNA (guanine2445-N2)-methyltransferase / 23S rRNA (guanine2069-N7)-methyltransferase
VWVSNPPYGERLGDEGEMIKLYSLLGANLVKQWHGWQVSLLGARADLMPRLGLRADKIWSLYNGALACKLMRFPVPDTVFTGGDDFANRLAKNYKHLNKWAKRNGVNAYRVYDADMPEFAVAVDVYDVGERHVVVQEYAPPKTVDPIAAEKRLRQALAHIQSVLELNGEQLHFKRREAQKGTQQYQRQGEDGKYHVVVEQDCKLYVNFEDYLDTGLFLDHRPLRQRLQREAAGKRFLNLYCYTGAATIHAATGGAESTVSVDLSNTYLDWLQQNLLLNGFVSPNSSPLTVRVNAGSRLVPHAKGQPHHLIRADVLEWLARAEDEGWAFDLIFCDPPTFSNSKKMQGIFDVQRDHVELIERAAALLSKDGVLYFSCNRRGFKLGELFQLQAQEITRETVDEDFKRPPPPHKAWRITRA